MSSDSVLKRCKWSYERGKNIGYIKMCVSANAEL